MENADRLVDQSAHLGEYGIRLIGPVKYLVSQRCFDQQINRSQFLKLAPDRACAGMNVARNLTDVKCLVMPAIQQGQYPATDLAEQQVR